MRNNNWSIYKHSRMREIINVFHLMLLSRYTYIYVATGPQSSASALKCNVAIGGLAILTKCINSITIEATSIKGFYIIPMSCLLRPPFLMLEINWQYNYRSWTQIVRELG